MLRAILSREISPCLEFEAIAPQASYGPLEQELALKDENEKTEAENKRESGFLLSIRGTVHAVSA
jgi:hypothetical protein